MQIGSLKYYIYVDSIENGFHSKKKIHYNILFNNRNIKTNINIFHLKSNRCSHARELIQFIVNVFSCDTFSPFLSNLIFLMAL